MARIKSTTRPKTGRLHRFVERFIIADGPDDTSYLDRADGLQVGPPYPRRALSKRSAEQWVDTHNPYIDGILEAELWERAFWFSQEAARERRSSSSALVAVWVAAALIAGIARLFVGITSGDGLLMLVYLFGGLAVWQLWWDSLADRRTK
ncbi:hypothetical protein EDF38_1272 [Frigoribacterium sp. PhB160]|uniref:hypothetical protein n=1 Tax=Frigoribacterium sp. PhB160 TaxID=2485192 RepID=UPI000F47A0CC|nr:hypothetical protein [Frigoribacterium sp. PhB160]ROS62169.1 hypothetical protein EDF38_1272 [Frigoribacterium sp. PhB160]